MTSRDARSPQGGWLLFELIVVVLVVAGLTVWAIEWANSNAITQTRTTAAQEMADEMRQLGRAAREYAKEQTWAEGSMNTITVASLISGNFVPAGFATRSTGAGRTPFGTTYGIRAKKESGGKYSIVVYEVGSNALLPANNMGYETATDPAIVAVKRASATKVRDAGVPAAIVKTGSRIANGIGSNPWTKDLTAYMTANATVDSVAVLIGFPDLAGFGDVTTDDAPSGFSGDCKIIMADAFRCKTSAGYPTTCDNANAVSWPYDPPTCPAGYTQVDTVTACASGVGFRSTSIGATLSYGADSQSFQGGLCDFGCKSAGVNCDGFQTTHRQQSVRLNDFEAGNMTCSVVQDANSYYDFGGTKQCGKVQSTRTSPAASGYSLLCCH